MKEIHFAQQTLRVSGSVCCVCESLSGLFSEGVFSLSVYCFPLSACGTLLGCASGPQVKVCGGTHLECCGLFKCVPLRVPVAPA